MAELPSGTVTFLYTDIEGSTQLWERQPEAMRAALERHDAILRQACQANGGQIFRTVGDAFCVAFASAPQAVAAAAAVQHLLADESWPLESPLRVRLALHSTAAEVQHGDYVGAGLNRIGRLLPVGWGGQVLLTQATQQLGRDSLPEGAHLRDLGQHRFRDLVQPERVYQLVIPGLPEHFPPLKTLDATPNNLPLQLTSFIGRERELTEVRGLLSTTHLLTLTGPGGTGKTRLALQAAASLIDEFPDGAWLVELAPLPDPALVPQTIAFAIKLREKSGQEMLEMVVEHLSQRKLLLVLDNCEHLIETCARVVDRLLHDCPDLKILISSREALGIAGEVSYRVPSLQLPGAQAVLNLADLGRAEAVQLFVARAGAVNPHFSLSHQNAAAVAQICRRLDGMPLAIELAAARLRLFSPEQIAARLDDRFRLLTGGSRTALPRQQTLQALIDWSYDLLAEPEKILLQRLSVFAGGWSFEAAEAVCAGDFGADRSIAAGQVMDLLEQLVNKSLVLVDDQVQELRYRFLETVRQYASQKLVSSGEAALVRQRHLAYFAEICDSFALDLFFITPGYPVEFAWLEREVDNLRLAQEWGLENDLENALRLAGDLFYLESQRGYGPEFMRFVDETIRRAEARPEYRPGGDPKSIELLSWAWTSKATLFIALGEHTKGFPAYDRALELSHLVKADRATALALGLKLSMYQAVHEAPASDQEMDEFSGLAHRLGNQSFIILAMLERAALARIRGGDEAGRKQQLKAKAEMDRDGNIFGSAMARIGLAFSAYGFEEFDEAEHYFEESLALYQQIGARQFENVSRSGLADVARMKKNFEDAIKLYLQVVDEWVEIGNLGAIARCLECLGFIALAQAGEDRSILCRAANLLGAAEALRKASGAIMTVNEAPEYEAFLADLKKRLDPDEFSAAWFAGALLDKGRAVDFAHESGCLLA